MGFQQNKTYSLQDILQPDGGKAGVSTDNDALAFCLSLAQHHYENFPVASVLLPKAMRIPICVVYAFARLADDIADEPLGLSIEVKYQGLALFDSIAESPGRYPSHPVARALAIVKQQHDIDSTTLRRLVEAFRRDITFTRNTSWEQFFEYCSYSANPVGEIILRIAGDANDESIARSNDICTGLQIVNMLQDLSIDLARGRHYLPVHIQDSQELAKAFDIVRTLFNRGQSVTHYVQSFRLRTELRMIIAGGRAILRKCEQLGTQLHTVRPTVGIFDYMRSVIRP